MVQGKCEGGGVEKHEQAVEKHGIHNTESCRNW